MRGGGGEEGDEAQKDVGDILRLLRSSGPGPCLSTLAEYNRSSSSEVWAVMVAAAIYRNTSLLHGFMEEALVGEKGKVVQGEGMKRKRNEVMREGGKVEGKDRRRGKERRERELVQACQALWLEVGGDRPLFSLVVVAARRGHKGAARALLHLSNGVVREISKDGARGQSDGIDGGGSAGESDDDIEWLDTEPNDCLVRIMRRGAAQAAAHVQAIGGRRSEEMAMAGVVAREMVESGIYTLPSSWRNFAQSRYDLQRLVESHSEAVAAMVNATSLDASMLLTSLQVLTATLCAGMTGASGLERHVVEAVFANAVQPLLELACLHYDDVNTSPMHKSFSSDNNNKQEYRAWVGYSTDDLVRHPKQTFTIAPLGRCDGSSFASRHFEGKCTWWVHEHILWLASQTRRSFTFEVTVALVRLFHVCQWCLYDMDVDDKVPEVFLVFGGGGEEAESYHRGGDFTPHHLKENAVACSFGLAAIILKEHCAALRLCMDHGDLPGRTACALEVQMLQHAGAGMWLEGFARGRLKMYTTTLSTAAAASGMEEREEMRNGGAMACQGLSSVACTARTSLHDGDAGLKYEDSIQLCRQCCCIILGEGIEYPHSLLLFKMTVVGVLRHFARQDDARSIPKRFVVPYNTKGEAHSPEEKKKKKKKKKEKRETTKRRRGGEEEGPPLPRDATEIDVTTLFPYHGLEYPLRAAQQLLDDGVFTQVLLCVAIVLGREEGKLEPRGGGGGGKEEGGEVEEEEDTTTTTAHKMRYKDDILGWGLRLLMSAIHLLSDTEGKLLRPQNAYRDACIIAKREKYGVPADLIDAGDISSLHPEVAVMLAELKQCLCPATRLPVAVTRKMGYALMHKYDDKEEEEGQEEEEEEEGAVQSCMLTSVVPHLDMSQCADARAFFLARTFWISVSHLSPSAEAEALHLIMAEYKHLWNLLDPSTRTTTPTRREEELFLCAEAGEREAKQLSLMSAIIHVTLAFCHRYYDGGRNGVNIGGQRAITIPGEEGEEEEGGGCVLRLATALASAATTLVGHMAAVLGRGKASYFEVLSFVCNQMLTLLTLSGQLSREVVVRRRCDRSGGGGLEELRGGCHLLLSSLPSFLEVLRTSNLGEETEARWRGGVTDVFVLLCEEVVAQCDALLVGRGQNAARKVDDGGGGAPPAAVSSEEEEKEEVLEPSEYEGTSESDGGKDRGSESESEAIEEDESDGVVVLD